LKAELLGGFRYDPIASFALGPVEGLVGAMQQFVGRIAIPV
jgi:hypothetical protein